MPAYVIALVDVKDLAAYERYKALAPPAIAAVGGKYLVRGGEVTVLEGRHDGRRVVILEFPSLDAARAFYDGEAYRRARDARQGAADMTMLLCAGLS